MILINILPSHFFFVFNEFPLLFVSQVMLKKKKIEKKTIPLSFIDYVPNNY